MDQPIDLATDTTVAFIGRALRGPLDTPVLIDSMTAFTRRFGGVWHRSSLGTAVEQFFAHGGKRLYVVRVANNARGAMVCLPARHGVLVLRAREPGSTEHIRASVDYDGIDEAEPTRFNLVVQRISPVNGLVVDQEIYNRVSSDESSRAWVGDALASSSLVTVQMPIPAGRPAATMGRGVDSGAPYAVHAQRGNDGAELSDYDLIGSAVAGTGLFSLEQLERLDLVYMPPPGRQRDVGTAAILAAAMYCRKRGAMLIMDPPAGWESSREAVAGMRRAGYASRNILGYFPRLVARGAPDEPPRAAGGAIAGMLARLDATAGPWLDLEEQGFAFRHELTPAAEMTGEDAAQLNRVGLNAIARRDGGRATIRGAVTLGRGSEADRQFTVLPARRLCLAISGAIERATRWALFEADGARVAERLRVQVEGYMQSLAAAGAFADDAFTVQCDAGLPSTPARPLRSVTVLLTFKPRYCDEPVSLTLHQTATGCRVATTAFAPVAA